MLNAKITADDWGMSKGINEGILHLAEKGIIHRVSCLANARDLNYLLPKLLNLKHIEIGLHFNLTYGASMLANGPAELLYKIVKAQLLSGSTLEKLNNTVQLEFNTQIEKLQKAGVKHITYFDGHHHCHLFPGLLKVIGPLALSKSITFTRIMNQQTLRLSPKLLLAPLSKFACIETSRLGLKYRPCSYPNLHSFKDTRKFKAFLLSLKPNTEVIAHPAAFDDSSSFEFPDSYTYQRVHEFHLLNSIL